MKNLYLALFSIFFIITSCKKDEVVPITSIANLNYNGRVSRIEFLGEYSKIDAIQFLGIQNPTHKIETTCGFRLYRFHYKTHRFDNAEIIVSGLMAVPSSNHIKGIVSWQHVTITNRKQSISTPSPEEGISIASLFAGNEYLLIASDYIGLGDSYEIHPYYHMKSTTNAVIDFLKVGEIVLSNLTNNLNHKLFLTGFSQGGGASVATQRELEKQNPTNLELIVNAPISGAYNLRGISLPYTLNNNRINSLIYIAYLSNAYSVIYNVPLNTFINEPYASLLPEWFNGSKDNPFLKDNLPPVKDLFIENFYFDLKNDVDNWYTIALDENEMYKWKPLAKIRFYYGLNDLDALPRESEEAYNYMKGIGGNVEQIALGPFDHEESVLEALPQIQQWFNSLQ